MVSREEHCLPSHSLTTDPTTNFDPAHDGFGFPNPVGWAPNRTGGGALLGQLDALVYEKGLCFGMVVASLATFYAAGLRRPPLAELPLTANLLEALRECQLRQFQPRVVLTTVLDWLTSGAGARTRTCCVSDRRSTGGSFRALHGHTPLCRTGSRGRGYTSTTRTIRGTGGGS